MSLLTYLFYPNPGNANYSSPKAIALLGLCAALVLVSFGIRYWRRGLQNPVTKRLSRSWASAAFWFGCIGLLLVVARMEPIQYVAMRIWWFVWIAAFVFYMYVQYRLFKAQHYEQMPKQSVDDPRDKYLPKKKKK